MKRILTRIIKKSTSIQKPKPVTRIRKGGCCGGRKTK